MVSLNISTNRIYHGGIKVHGHRTSRNTAAQSQYASVVGEHGEGLHQTSDYLSRLSIQCNRLSTVKARVWQNRWVEVHVLGMKKGRCQKQTCPWQAFALPFMANTASR